MTEINSRRILVHAPIGRDGPVCASLITQSGMSTELCSTVTDVLAAIEDGAAGVFIAEEALFGRDLSDFSTWVMNQPAWSDLPFIILTSHHDEPLIVQWRQRLVTALRNVSLLERPIYPISLTSTVQSAVRARQRQYEVRQLLDERAKAAAVLETQVIDRTRELEKLNSDLRTEIAERMRIEEELLQTRKIEAIGQLTGGVAHDFNNLLMVVSSGMDLLERRPDDPVRRSRLLSRMREAVARGTTLTRHLLTFSRRQALQPEAVNLATHIGNMRELLGRSLRGDVDVHVDVPADIWPVEIDPGELELAILNLAVNARDAMPNGGTIILRAQNAPGEKVLDEPGDLFPYPLPILERACPLRSWNIFLSRSSPRRRLAKDRV